MTTVNTVAGPLDPNDLGLTLTHEHMRVRREPVFVQFPKLYDEEVEWTRALTQIRNAQTYGLKSICDPSVMGLGRNVRFIKRLADETGLQVVVATGIYTHNELPSYFDSRSAEAMAEVFVDEFENGIQGTDIKPGFLKCATDKLGFTPAVEKTIRGVAKAHVQTGLPIMTHSHALSESGLRQQDILEEEGVDLTRVIIGHSGDTDDVDYLAKLASRGSFLGLDRYGLEDMLTTDRRNRTTVRLVELGFTDRMLLSHDHPCTYDREETAETLGQRPDWNWTHIFEHVIPDIVKMGVPQEAVDQMMVDNAKAWLAGTK